MPRTCARGRGPSQRSRIRPSKHETPAELGARRMGLTVAIQMDPIERIDIAGDSTFALALEAQSRGHSLLYYGPRDLTFGEGKVTARARPLEVRAGKGHHYTLGETVVQDLAAVDV